MNIEKYIFNEENNNISDLISLYKDGCLDNILVKKTYNINIQSTLTKNCKKININQLIITNLDNYISYVKSILLIDQQQIRYIISLTINNKYNKILKSNKYFSDNITYYNNNFSKMLFFNYNKNYCLLKKYNIKYHNNLYRRRLFNKNIFNKYNIRSIYNKSNRTNTKLFR